MEGARDPGRRARARVSALLILTCAALTLGFGAAADGSASDADDAAADASKVKTTAKATGTVDVPWRGGRGSPADPTQAKTASAELTVIPDPWRGEFIYRVFTPAGDLHREVRAQVVNASFAGTTVWACALVVADQRWGGGGGGDGGGGGCGGGGCGSEGGCDGHDDGCEDDSGGCDDGMETTSVEAAGGSGMTASGGGSRVGQYVVVRVQDLATPGRNGDTIAWHWLTPEYGSTIDLSSTPWTGHLCPKTILGGNLVVH